MTMMIVIVVVTSLPAKFVVMHGTGPHSRKDVVDKVLYYCSPIEPNYGFDSLNMLFVTIQITIIMCAVLNFSSFYLKFMEVWNSNMANIEFFYLDEST